MGTTGTELDICWHEWGDYCFGISIGQGNQHLEIVGGLYILNDRRVGQRGMYFCRLKYSIYSVHYGVTKVFSDTRVAKRSYSYKYMCAKYHVLKNQLLLNPCNIVPFGRLSLSPPELHNTMYS